MKPDDSSAARRAIDAAVDRGGQRVARRLRGKDWTAAYSSSTGSSSGIASRPAEAIVGRPDTEITGRDRRGIPPQRSPRARGIAHNAGVRGAVEVAGQKRVYREVPAVDAAGAYRGIAASRPTSPRAAFEDAARRATAVPSVEGGENVRHAFTRAVVILDVDVAFIAVFDEDAGLAMRHAAMRRRSMLRTGVRARGERPCAQVVGRAFRMSHEERCSPAEHALRGEGHGRATRRSRSTTRGPSARVIATMDRADARRARLNRCCGFAARAVAEIGRARGEAGAAPLEGELPRGVEAN